jgi:hypothetical protein
MNNIEFKKVFDYKVIYVFTIDDEKHKGLVKIGDTTLNQSTSIDKLLPNCKELKKAALNRIKSYTNTAGVSPILLHTELAIKEIDKTAFRDYDVHKVLENSNIKREKLDGSTGREWFKIEQTTAIQAIQAVKKGQSNLSNQKTNNFFPIIFRPEQEEAIEKTVKQFQKNNRMLWNAKMRFGKTLCALEVIKRMKFKKTIILTHRPVVNEGWYEDFTKIFYDMDYIYGTKVNGDTVKALNNQEKNFVFFASIQDLRGSKKVGGKFDKNNEIFKTIWDCVIVDEAHEGTKTALGDDTIKAVIKAEDKKTKLLALSGTPFNILDEYDNESIYTWDYIMEQECKVEWDIKNFGDSNPYKELPELRIYTYDLGDLLHNDNYITYEDKAFNFSEFFRTWTGEYKYDYAYMPEDTKIGDFIHKKDIISFLNLMTKKDNNNYPYSSNEYRELFKHSLWVIPGIREAKALKNLMLEHSVFGNGQFNIINVAGSDNEEATNALTSVKTAIKEAEENNMYTITLSCGKLTTGVTIKEWTAVFMLSGSYSTSAANYLQTIFRVQSPCNKNGMIKERAYVFDFAPDRTLKMISEAVSISAKAGKTKSSDKIILGKFLNYCPVISISGSEMKEYKTNSLLQQLKKAYADRVVTKGFDDKNLYNDELLKLDEIDIEKFNKLKGIIGTSKAAKDQNDITINDQGLTAEEYEIEERLKKKSKKFLTVEEQSILEDFKKKKKVKKDAISILRGISIRMPLLIYGADIPYNEDITLEQFIDKIDNSSWDEFMPVGVTKEIFKEFKKYYDEDIFIAAGRRIRNIAREADTLSPLERIKKITQLFSNFKNPDKETVLTPWRVVNMHLSDCLGGYNFWNKKCDSILDEPYYVDKGKITSDIFNKSSKILEINSKTGLYPLYIAYSIFRNKCNECKEELTIDVQNKIWEDTIKNNIFAICKTPMAKQITQRTLLGYSNMKINAHYLDDLINQMQNKSEQFIERILKNNYWKKGEGKMKFDAIVGNPPYQENISTSNKNASLSKQLFPYFIMNAINLGANYVSLITPSRYFTGSSQDKSFIKLRKFLSENNHYREIYHYNNANDVFKDVTIAGGVSYFLYEKDYLGDVSFTEFINNLETTTKRPLFENGLDVIISMSGMISILNKVRLSNNFISMTEKTFGRDAFGVVGKEEILEKLTSKYYHNKAVTVFCAYEEIRYIDREKIEKNIDMIDKYKIFISKGNGGAGIINMDKAVSILGKTHIGKPNSICTDSLIPIGPFETKEEVINLKKYMSTKFLRFMVGILKTSQNIYQTVYQFVPLQDFSNKSDINWNKSISEIDLQLYRKYNLNEEEQKFIEERITVME